jgi:hypothetical protein
MVEATHSSKTLVPTRATRRHIPEDGILHYHLGENHSSYIREYNSQPADLEHNALSNYAVACPTKLESLKEYRYEKPTLSFCMRLIGCFSLQPLSLATKSTSFN